MVKTGFKNNWNNFRNKNDNIKNPEEEEKNKIQRPRSRQSAFSPVACDFEFVGNVNNVS